MIKSNAEYYKKIDELIIKLRKNRQYAFAERLKNAKASGFMASEILGETSLVLQKIFKQSISIAN